MNLTVGSPSASAGLGGTGVFLFLSVNRILAIKQIGYLRLVELVFGLCWRVPFVWVTWILLLARVLRVRDGMGRWLFQRGLALCD